MGDGTGFDFATADRAGMEAGGGGDEFVAGIGGDAAADGGYGDEDVGDAIPAEGLEGIEGVHQNVRKCVSADEGGLDLAVGLIRGDGEDGLTGAPERREVEGKEVDIRQGELDR